MKKDNFKHNHKNRLAPSDIGTKTCFATKQVKPRSEMLRFVSSPNRVIVFDVAEKLPGHGFWLSADKTILAEAISKRLFYKAAKGTVVIPPDLQAQVETMLKNRALNLLSLCRKAGLLIFGETAVKKALDQGHIACGIEATDSSERGHLFLENDSFPVFNLFTSSELGQILSQSQVMHLCLLKGSLSEQVLLALCKIVLYNGAN